MLFVYMIAAVAFGPYANNGKIVRTTSYQFARELDCRILLAEVYADTNRDKLLASNWYYSCIPVAIHTDKPNG